VLLLGALHRADLVDRDLVHLQRLDAPPVLLLQCIHLQGDPGLPAAGGFGRTGTELEPSALL